MKTTHWHKHFAKALTSPDLPPPKDVVRTDGKIDLKRFNVYRNNHVASLITNLKDGFPVVAAIVGDAFFDHMVRVFVEKYPPHSPVMIFYGDKFPEFIRNFQQVSELPYLADVAELEYLQRLSLHASDAPFIFINQISYDVQTLLEAHFKFHPSVYFMSSDFPIFDIWYANQGNFEKPIRADAQDVVLVRHDNRVSFHLVQPECRRFLNSLANGANVREAINNLNAQSAEIMMNAIKFSLTLLTSITLPEERN